MNSDRLTRALTAFVRQVLSPTDYHALYPGRVVSQSGDVLDIQPDDERLPGVTGVPMRLGIPGVTVKVSPGARVLLGFEEGDPSRPVATLWESQGIEEISLAGGTASVARVGDQTVIGYLSAVDGTGAPVTFLLSPDPDAEIEWDKEENKPILPAGGSGGPTIKLEGQISEGAEKVKVKA